MIPLKQSDTEIRKTQTEESLCVYFKNKSTSLSKLVAFNKNVPLVKEEVISDSSHEFMKNRLTREISMENKTTHVRGSLIFVSENLAKSKSMPILKSEISNWDSYRDAIPTFVNESVANLTNDGDLVDVARNSYSSIKSIYFPPNPSDPSALPNDFAKSRKHQRISTDVEALLKIDYELSPLRYQYSEIIGKTRALGLSGAGFDLGISCRLDQPDRFDQSVLSPNESNYLLDCDQTFLRRAATNCNFENRSGLVDNTSPSPTFSVVGKPAPTGSHISCLNENSSNRRQKALSFAIRDLSRTAESLNGLRFCNPVRKSASYLPATNNYASQEEKCIRHKNVLGERSCDECISNNNSQLYRKPNAVKGTISAWDGWSVHERVNTSPSNVLCRTEYNSHRYLNRTVENSRTSGNNFFEVRKQESSVFIMIDDNWPIVHEETTNKRLKEHFEVLPDDQNSMMVQSEFATRNSNHRKNILPETESVVKNDRISSTFESKLIDHCIGRDRQISRAVSASTCASQVGVNLNTKVCTTVEKHYTSRAVSPIRNFLSTTSPNNMLVTASVSSIFMQQVHADFTTEVVKIEPPSKIRSVEINKKNDAAVATSKRDFCVQKIDSQRDNAENLSRFSDFEKDQADLMTEHKKAQHLRLSKSIADAKEKITIVPIVLTDGVSQSPRIADVDFAVPRYINKMVPQLNYQIVPFEARKSRRMPSSSNRDNEISRRNVADSVCLNDKLRAVNEKCWRMHRTSVSRASHNSLYTQEEYAPSNVVRSSKRSTRVTTSNARVGEKMREYYKSVPKAIPGMRSSPEDFLCET
ncbi:phosphoribosylaminoimidazolecarboxamide formyltransferase [Lasius niger]|uniref:Phosphoribosylaminoimidazolecarboxamide formyltransferase n=1 Tax=Lasius niger TaxID=67767 RepID=A0A0J7L141_LASNI|nr:phosphoribosylaminoimidazolecarboxamide formyltransferase [Lasius niger]